MKKKDEQIEVPISGGIVEDCIVIVILEPKVAASGEDTHTATLVVQLQSFENDWIIIFASCLALLFLQNSAKNQTKPTTDSTHLPYEIKALTTSILPKVQALSSGVSPSAFLLSTSFPPLMSFPPP